MINIVIIDFRNEIKKKMIKKCARKKERKTTEEVEGKKITDWLTQIFYMNKILLFQQWAMRQLQFFFVLAQIVMNIQHVHGQSVHTLFNCRYIRTRNIYVIRICRKTYKNIN